MSAPSFLDKLASAINNPSVMLHKFLLELNTQHKIVHAFFEGKTDESFYGTFIRKMIDKEYELRTYICGNKDGVYYQFNRLNQKSLGNSFSLFFVDKDIEDIIPFHRICDSKIYVTDYYSVENYIVNEVILEQVWSEIFRQGSGNKASNLIKSKFVDCLNDFHHFMLLVMCWILYHKRNIEKQQSVKLNLDCVKLKNAYQINNNLEFNVGITDDEIINLLSSQTKCRTSLVEFNKNKNILIDELKTHPFKNIVRGHFEMEFFIYFIGVAKDVLIKALGKVLKLHLEISEANAIDVLGPRVQMPKSLDEFMAKNIKHQLSFNLGE